MYASQEIKENLSPGVSLKAYDALILEARLRQSLTAVRSLGQRGLSVAAMETFDGVPAFASRWCREAFVCADDGAEAYLNFLEGILTQASIRVLITSTDAHAKLLSQHRERFEGRVRLALAKEPALSIALNKEHTLGVAERLGLHVPRGVPVKESSEVEAALREVGLPAIVKPAESWSWKSDQGKGLASKLITSADEAKSFVDEVAQQGLATIFQQYLEGRREAISFLYADGRVYARFAQWAKRTMPPLGGTSVLRQSIALPSDTGEQAERLVREIDLEGYSEVEFRRDRAGVPYLMEINPRLSASVEIAVRAGVDFPYLLYQWASGEKIEAVSHYRVGGWMRHLGGDIESTLETIQLRGRPEMASPARALGGFFLSFLQPMRYDYWDHRDLAPTWRAVYSSARYWSGRIGKRLVRKKSEAE
jgi:predicted ATP-grasp superfamily ATP-dependent carboligase